jgi:hypothetical protein
VQFAGGTEIGALINAGQTLGNPNFGRWNPEFALSQLSSEGIIFGLQPAQTVNILLGIAGSTSAAVQAAVGGMLTQGLIDSGNPAAIFSAVSAAIGAHILTADQAVVVYAGLAVGAHITDIQGQNAAPSFSGAGLGGQGGGLA